MSNSNLDNQNEQSSANPAEPMAENEVSPREGDVPIVGRRSRAPTDQLRTVRRPTIDRANRRRYYTINLGISRRILSLSNNSRSSVISVLAEALGIEYSPTVPTPTVHRTENDQSYNYEFRLPKQDDVNNSSPDNNCNAGITNNGGDNAANTNNDGEHNTTNTNNYVEHNTENTNNDLEDTAANTNNDFEDTAANTNNDVNDFNGHSGNEKEPPRRSFINILFGSLFGKIRPGDREN